MAKNNFKRIRVIKDPEKVRELLSLPEEYGISVITIGKEGLFDTYTDMLLNGTVKFSDSLVVELKLTKLEITTKYLEGKVTTYIFDLNEEKIGQASGQKCFSVFQKAYKIPKIEDKELIDEWLDPETGKFSCSASPIIGYNPLFEKQELVDCYEYDINSAYSSVMMERIPDLYHPDKTYRKVKSGEVGFILNERLTIVETGGYAEIIFPLIDTPESLKKYLFRWYNQKANSKKGSQEKKDAKDMLNLPIGYCQRWNPFFRAFIVNRCNRVIKDLLDEDSVLWNTDAIISLRRREDLEIGEGLGQFKETKIDVLRYIGNVYQLNDENPVYRGIPKNWFRNFREANGRPFNLLTDGTPQEMNKYEFDLKTLKLEEKTYAKEKAH